MGARQKIAKRSSWGGHKEAEKRAEVTDKKHGVGEPFEGSTLQQRKKEARERVPGTFNPAEKVKTYCRKSDLHGPSGMNE